MQQPIETKSPLSSTTSFETFRNSRKIVISTTPDWDAERITNEDDFLSSHSESDI